MDEYWIAADRWFDGDRLHDQPVAIAVAGGTICQVVPGGTAAADGGGARRFPGGLLMPGLINVHAHLPRLGAFEPAEPVAPAGIADTVRRTLASGITTVADMGSTLGLITALRAHTAADPSAGPSIRAAGPVVTAPGGYPFDWLPPLFRFMGVARTCTDARSARDTVGEIARGGADHVKIAVMHESYGGRALPVLTSEAASAVVAEAHALGLRVYAHAHSELDYALALAAGVDALAHSSFTPLSPDTVRRIADTGTPVCPTLWVFESICLGAEHGWHQDPVRIRALHPALVRSWRWFAEAYAASGAVLPEGSVAAGREKSRVVEAVRVASANLRLLTDNGVRIAFGNDASYGYALIHRPHEELCAMERAGMASVDVLRAATGGAADYLGLSDRGRLRVGQRADVLVVDCRSSADLEHLARPLAVFAAGVPVDAAARGRRATVSDTLAVVYGLAASVAAATRAGLGQVLGGHGG